jgi:hypothetical protein
MLDGEGENQPLDQSASHWLRAARSGKCIRPPGCLSPSVRSTGARNGQAARTSKGAVGKRRWERGNGGETSHRNAASSREGGRGRYHSKAVDLSAFSRHYLGNNALRHSFGGKEDTSCARRGFDWEWQCCACCCGPIRICHICGCVSCVGEATRLPPVLPNAKSAQRATSSSPSPSVRQGWWGAGTATHDAGGLPQAAGPDSRWSGEAGPLLKPPSFDFTSPPHTPTHSDNILLRSMSVGEKQPLDQSGRARRTGRELHEAGSAFGRRDVFPLQCAVTATGHCAVYGRGERPGSKGLLGNVGGNVGGTSSRNAASPRGGGSGRCHSGATGLSASSRHYPCSNALLW